MVSAIRPRQTNRGCFSLVRWGRSLLILLSLCPYLCGATNSASHDSPPRRIISLGPTITEKLYDLGVEESVVGVTVYCRRPVRAALKEKVGNVTHVSVEKIIRLKPDLVVATALTDFHLVKKLRKANIRTEVFAEPKSFEGLNQQYVDLGRMVGKEREALRTVALAEERVRAVSLRVGDKRRPRVFCQIGAHPLFTAVANTLLNDIIELAKGTNIAKAARVGFYNREEVIRQNPDVIIIVTMGLAAEEEKRTWLRFKGIHAVGNGRVFVMDAYRTCSPTPLSFADAVAEIADILHPGTHIQEGRIGSETEPGAGSL